MTLLTIIAVGLFSLGIGSINTNTVKDYENFASINMSKGKLIRNWTTNEINTYKSKVPSKRKFYGWQVYMVNEEVECSFESEILFSFYNTGTSTMEYNKTITYAKAVKTSISCTGSIGYTVSGTIKKFKNNLDTEVKYSYSSSTSTEEKQTDTLKITVEPGYKAIVYMTGTARVTNGYGQHYIFWCKNNSGAFEYFTITDQYPRVKKVAI